jgi:hypothetical protein
MKFRTYRIKYFCLVQLPMHVLTHLDRHSMYEARGKWLRFHYLFKNEVFTDLFF